MALFTIHMFDGKDRIRNPIREVKAWMEERGHHGGWWMSRTIPNPDASAAPFHERLYMIDIDDQDDLISFRLTFGDVSSLYGTP